MSPRLAPGWALAIAATFLAWLTLAACSPEVELPAGALISCSSASDCPGDLVCHHGRCVAAEGIDTTPPDLAAAPAVSPAAGRAGTSFEIVLEPTEPLEGPPEVALRLLEPAFAPCTADGARWRCTYTATGDENGGLGGNVPFDVRLVDRGKNETMRRLAGSLVLDFAPPALLLANAAYLPAPSNPLPAVTRATAGTRVLVTLTADEVLDTVVPPALEGHLGGTILPFSPVPGSLEANSVAFEATVPAGLPDGDYALSLTWSDAIGNVDAADVPSPVVRVKTSLPTLTVEQSAVTYLRAPWGVADVGLPLTSPPMPAGQVFAALAPGDPLSTAPLLAPSAFTAPEGIAILRIWKDATRTSLLAARVSPEPGGWPRLLVPGGEELPTVWVTAVDDAGNESGAVRLANAEWVATAGKPVVGASPHRIHSTYYAPDTLALGPSVSEPHATASPLLGLVVQAHSALRARYPERRVGPGPRRDFGAAFDVARGVMVLHGGSSAAGAALEDTWEWDGTSWTEVVPATGFVPGPTPPPPMTYDGARGRIVLEDSDYSLWEWDGAAWEQTTRTAGNWRGYMAYDAALERVVMIPNGHSQFNAMEWDGYAWTYPPGATPPGPRERGAMAYDAHRGVMVFFGGRDPSYAGTTTYGELWERDAAGWRLVPQAGPQPGPRHGHGLVNDAAAGRVLLVGGADASGALHSDVWAWNGAAWTDVTPPAPSPAPRRDAAVAFDPARARLILHGGLGAGDTLLDDTWELGAGGWEDVSVTRATPPPRWAHAMAYDPVRQVIVLHGGASWVGVDDAVWEYDGLWRNVTPPASEPAPPRLTYHAMVFHAATGRMLVFGGSGPYGPWTGVWQWTGTAWIDRTPTGAAPPHREGFAASYDPAAAVVRVTGGLVYDGAYHDLADHWELSSAGDRMAWYQRSSTAPVGVARSIHAQFWDGSRTLLMGGYNQSSGPTEDAWAYDGTNWTRVASTAAGQGLSRGGASWDPVRRRGVLLGDPYLETDFYRLEWLGDRFRAIAPTSTERWPLYNRNETAIAHDDRRNRTVIFGGFKRPANLALGDTWEVDADLDARGLQRRSPAVQLTVHYDSAGFALSRVTGLRVRARAGGDFAPSGEGARLLGWHRGGLENPGGRWVTLAENADGLPLGAMPGGLLEWTASADERARFFLERDSELAFQLRPAGAPPPAAAEATVQAEYLEVRVRYTTAP